MEAPQQLSNTYLLNYFYSLVGESLTLNKLFFTNEKQFNNYPNLRFETIISEEMLKTFTEDTKMPTIVLERLLSLSFNMDIWFSKDELTNLAQIVAKAIINWSSSTLPLEDKGYLKLKEDVLVKLYLDNPYLLALILIGQRKRLSEVRVL